MRTRAAATTATNADGDAGDADIASGAGGALELAVKRACGLGADGDLVAHASGNHELSWSCQNLEIL